MQWPREILSTSASFWTRPRARADNSAYPKPRQLSKGRIVHRSCRVGPQKGLVSGFQSLPRILGPTLILYQKININSIFLIWPKKHGLDLHSTLTYKIQMAIYLYYPFRVNRKLLFFLIPIWFVFMEWWGAHFTGNNCVLIWLFCVCVLTDWGTDWGVQDVCVYYNPW
jgi:hypothetical protein